MMRVVTIHVVIAISLMIFPFWIHSQDVTSLLKEADALWDQKEESEKVKEAITFYKKVLKLDASHYEACWKIARAYFSLGDRLPGDEQGREIRKKVGEGGIKYAKKALALSHQGLEGHYYYALCLSQYSIGIGSVKTVLKRLDKEYENHMQKVLALNRYYDYAGPLKALGRYWYYLPWPKKDIKKSIQYLKEAVSYAPDNVRARVYLAESYLKDGKNEPARNQLLKAIEILPDPKQEVDVQRWKERARKLLMDVPYHP